MGSTFNAIPETAMLATLTHPADCDLPTLQPRLTVRVRSADELRAALREARSKALTLDGRTLDRVLRIDLKAGIAEVQAGTTWAELAVRLAAEGIPIEPFAACGLPATVGESVSQMAAGPDGDPVGAHVLAL